MPCGWSLRKKKKKFVGPRLQESRMSRDINTEVDVITCPLSLRRVVGLRRDKEKARNHLNGGVYFGEDGSHHNSSATS